MYLEIRCLLNESEAFPDCAGRVCLQVVGTRGKLHLLLRKGLYAFNNESVETGHSELPSISVIGIPNLISFSATGHAYLSRCGRWFSTTSANILKESKTPNGGWVLCGLKSWETWRDLSLHPQVQAAH